MFSEILKLWPSLDVLYNYTQSLEDNTSFTDLIAFSHVWQWHWHLWLEWRLMNCHEFFMSVHSCGDKQLKSFSSLALCSNNSLGGRGETSVGSKDISATWLGFLKGASLWRFSGLCQLASHCLGTPWDPRQGEQESVAGKRDIRNTLLSLLAYRSEK